MYDVALSAWQEILREQGPHNKTMLRLLELDPEDEFGADGLEEEIWEKAEALVDRETQDEDLRDHVMAAMCYQLGQILERRSILAYQRRNPAQAMGICEVASTDEAYDLWLADRMEEEKPTAREMARRLFPTLEKQLS